MKTKVKQKLTSDYTLSTLSDRLELCVWQDKSITLHSRMFHITLTRPEIEAFIKAVS